MRALVQRVKEGGVTIQSENYEEKIGHGIVLLLGVKEGDTIEDANFVADKCCNLRIFNDENDKMNLSIKDVNGEMLIISQFTLYGNAQKGNRPSYSESANPELANQLYEKFNERVRNNIGKERVKTGIFAAMMEVNLVNDGPATIMVESKGG